jgi:hypothetical protein
MNARGNIYLLGRASATLQICDAPTRDANPARALASDSVVRNPGANLGKSEKLWATHFRYLNPA